MSLVDDRFEQERRIKVAKAAVRARKTLREIDADMGGDENLRGALMRLEEFVADEPHYVQVALRTYFVGTQGGRAHKQNAEHWGLS